MVSPREEGEAREGEGGRKGDADGGGKEVRVELAFSSQ